MSIFALFVPAKRVSEYVCVCESESESMERSKILHSESVGIGLKPMFNAEYIVQNTHFPMSWFLLVDFFLLSFLVKFESHPFPFHYKYPIQSLLLLDGVVCNRVKNKLPNFISANHNLEGKIRAPLTILSGYSAPNPFPNTPSNFAV